MRIDIVNPYGWTPPKGYSNGILAEGSFRMLFVAGQVAWDAEQRLVGAGDFVTQFKQALANVLAVVKEAGGWPDHLVRLTIYVTDKRVYMDKTREVGHVYRALMGKHFPAMSLVQVADLLEEGALVEIEATATLPA